MCALPFANGASRKACPRIRCKPSSKAATWSVYRGNVRRETCRAFLPMPKQKSYLAIDLGAESGRAILGRFDSGTLAIEEVHRFPNQPVEYGGSLHWDIARLWFEIQ